MRKGFSIAAASILAKVTRDELMDEMDRQYPAYDFKSNKGYGTKKHLEALNKICVLPLIIEKFSPVQEILLKRRA